MVPRTWGELRCYTIQLSFSLFYYIWYFLFEIYTNTHHRFHFYFCCVLPLGFSDDDIERKAADASRELASKRARLKAEIQMLQQHLGGSAEGAEKAKGIQAIKMKSSLSKKQAALADLSNEGGGSGSGGGGGGGVSVIVCVKGLYGERER